MSASIPALWTITQVTSSAKPSRARRIRVPPQPRVPSRSSSAPRRRSTRPFAGEAGLEDDAHDGDRDHEEEGQAVRETRRHAGYDQARPGQRREHNERPAEEPEHEDDTHDAADEDDDPRGRVGRDPE